jgi:hypothetical protein
MGPDLCAVDLRRPNNGVIYIFCPCYAGSPGGRGKFNKYYNLFNYSGLKQVEVWFLL